MKKTAIMWECKVGINDIIANFVCMWKSQFKTSSLKFIKVNQKYVILNNLNNYGQHYLHGSWEKHFLEDPD